MDTSERILREYETVAVVGLSRDPDKAAHGVPKALKAAGYRIIPVNPNGGSLLGETVYPTLAEIPHPVDVVLVFRPSAEAEAIARDAVSIGAKALWLQLGITSAAARSIAEGAGLAFVEDHCIGVERARHQVIKRRASERPPTSS